MHHAHTGEKVVDSRGMTECVWVWECGRWGEGWKQRIYKAWKMNDSLWAKGKTGLNLPVMETPKTCT